MASQRARRQRHRPRSAAARRYDLAARCGPSRARRCGARRSTPEASARYMFASSSRLTSDAPSTVVGYGWSGVRMPSSRAVRSTGFSPDPLGDPHGRAVARLGQGQAHRDDALELAVVVADPLRRPSDAHGHRDGLVETLLSRRSAAREARSGRRSASAPSPAGGSDSTARLKSRVGRVAVACSTWRPPASARTRASGWRSTTTEPWIMPLAAGCRFSYATRPALQRLVDDRLHAVVHRRVDADAAVRELGSSVSRPPVAAGQLSSSKTFLTAAGRLRLDRAAHGPA